MAKSRKRKKSKRPSSAKSGAKSGSSSGGVDWGGGREKKSGNGKLILPLIGVAAVIGAGVYIWQISSADKEFQALAAQGKGALSVESFGNSGQTHLSLGQTYRYNDSYPTSGPHAPRPTPAGFYTTSQPATALVHAMEHGNVVVYYDAGDKNIIKTIKGWTGIYGGVWDGVVAVPRGGLKNQVVLSAWRKRLKLKPFNEVTAAAFIDSYRGRGPERAVR